MDIGTELTQGGTRFRVWAPRAREVELLCGSRTESVAQLNAEDDGYFSGVIRGAGPGTLYRYRLDGKGPYPDPCSRFQPQGPHGPSMVIDPEAYRWKDDGWKGLRIKGQVLYEMHIGAFTREGTFDATSRELCELAALGVTCVEVMPVGDFPGEFNWGYDAVNLFAPYHGYGDPDAFKRFVDAAHACGIGVILDVVYNHLGADGNYLKCFSPDYFTDRYPNEWGEAINFDGPGCQAVRHYFLSNAEYWVREFHLDGLRVDATQSLHDSTRPHIAQAIVERSRAAAAPRDIILVAENEPQRVELILPPAEGGMGYDAVWNDDFHHSARVALTGSREGYFHDYRGRAQELASGVKHGFLFQGQYYCWQKKPRGTPTYGCPSWSFVNYLQNHDQVANTFYGQRLHEITSPGRLRAMTALLLLAPQTPMLFMGQEFGASAPFSFFANHKPDLAAQVWQGRKKFMRQFATYATSAAQTRLRDPAQAETFSNSKLTLGEREAHKPTYDLYKDLLKLRREDALVAAQRRQSIDCAVLGENALVIRWFGDGQDDRLLLVNLGTQLDLLPGPEPLLAPPRDRMWKIMWSSDEIKYGGPGAIDLCHAGLDRLPAECAVLLRASRA